MLKCKCGLSPSLNSSMISNLNPLYTEEGPRQNPLLALPPFIPGLRSFYAKNSHSGALSLLVLHHVLASSFVTGKLSSCADDFLSWYQALLKVADSWCPSVELWWCVHLFHLIDYPNTQHLRDAVRDMDLNAWDALPEILCLRLCPRLVKMRLCRFECCLKAFPLK